MRTKTLLIAAAALAATVTASKAQTSNVYSANVVGYINVTLPANAFTLVGGQLDQTPNTNTVNTVLTSGFLGAASGAAESVAYFWTGGGYDTLYYYNSADVAGSGYAPGWYDSVSGLYSSNAFGSGLSCFVQNPSGAALTATVTGTVDQGSNFVVSAAVQPGFSLYSEPSPLAGTAIDSTNINFPATSELDEYQLWEGNGYGTPYAIGDGLYYYDTADAAPYPAGWYDAETGLWEDTNPAYWPNVGQGFIVIHGGGTSNWVTTFEVQ